MNTTTESTPHSLEQAPSTPVAEQAPSQAAPLAQTTAQPNAETTQTTPSLPTEVQSRLAELEARNRQLDESMRYHQSQASKFQQALVGLTGQTPAQQNDPIAPFVEQYTKIGIAETDARVLAQRDYATEQRFQQLQNAVAGQTQVPVAIQQAVAGMPQLQAVQHQIHADIQQEVARGNMNALNPEYIKTIGARYYLDSLAKHPTGQAAPPNPQSLIPQFPSQFGPINGYQTPQVASNPNALPPGLEQWRANEAAQINARYGLNPSK